MTDFSLRQYQIDALNIIHEDLQSETEVLLCAIMGSGKTTITARLINRYWWETERRFLILAHKKELVQQFYDTFRSITNIPFYDIGICSAGLNERILNKRLTISTVQTFVNVNDYSGADLLVVDEAHRIEIKTGSQYDQVINSLRQKTPSMRILGLTATPSRLNNGYIYGNRCRPGTVNLFPKLNHNITYSELFNQGYLCGLKGKIAHADSLESDLDMVEISGGDYVLNRLGDVMCRQIHLSTAVQAIKEHCSDYKMICIFCCTIEHAEKIKALLGDESTIIHSNLSPLEREINMRKWLAGEIRICTSVNILTEGVDIPRLDCLVFARPTLSSTLFLQAVGRVLRPFPGKTHGFLLDLTANTAFFGTDLDNVRVTIPQSVKGAIEKDRLSKLCPQCEREVFSGLRVCPNCGFEWPVAEIIEANSVPDLKEVNFEKKPPAPPKWMGVIDMRIDMHESNKSGKFLGKISFFTDDYYSRPITVWLCLSDFYSGWAIEASRRKWSALMPGEELPKSVEDFVQYKIPMPTEILVDATEKFPEVQGYRFDEGPDFEEVPGDYNLPYNDNDDIPF